MSSAVTIEFEKLLTPIADNSPSGESLLRIACCDATREACRAEDPSLGQGDPNLAAVKQVMGECCSLIEAVPHEEARTGAGSVTGRSGSNRDTSASDY